MPTLRTIAVIGCLLASVAAEARAQGKIPWLTDWRQAREIAQREHRLILLHFWSNSCAPCKKLEQGVFNRPEVARALHAGYIPVKINVDSDKQLATHYRVSSSPTDVVVDATGRVVHRQTSPQDPNQYIAFLDRVKSHHAVAMTSGDVSASGIASQAAPSSPRHLATHNRFAASGAPGNYNAGATAPASGHRGSSFVAGSQFTGSTAANASAPQNPLTADNPPRTAATSGPYANPYLSNAPAATGGNDAQPAGSSMAANTSAFAGGGFQTDSQPANRSPASANPTNTGWQNQPANPAVPSPNGYVASRPPSNTTAITSQFSQGGIANATPQANNWTDQGARQATATRVTRPPLPSQSSTIGLESYCPVTLVERNTWSRGDARWGAVHQGRTYLFTSYANQQRFLVNPDAFAPVMSGYDPVRYIDTGAIVEGKRRHGLYYGNKYFLFADEDALQRFQAGPNRYMTGGTTQ